MEYVNLGRSGVKVSCVCLGSMTFGKQRDFGIDEKESVDIVLKSLQEGINFIDTADLYGYGLSEEIIGRALVNRRHEVILATMEPMILTHLTSYTIHSFNIF